MPFVGRVRVVGSRKWKSVILKIDDKICRLGIKHVVVYVGGMRFKLEVRGGSLGCHVVIPSGIREMIDYDELEYDIVKE